MLLGTIALALAAPQLVDPCEGEVALPEVEVAQGLAPRFTSGGGPAGTCTVAVTHGADGVPTAVLATDCAGERAVAAVAAARAWRFHPPTCDGSPVSARTQVHIPFRPAWQRTAADEAAVAAVRSATAPIAWEGAGCKLQLRLFADGNVGDLRSSDPSRCLPVPGGAGWDPSAIGGEPRECVLHLDARDGAAHHVGFAPGCGRRTRAMLVQLADQWAWLSDAAPRAYTVEVKLVGDGARAVLPETAVRVEAPCEELAPPEDAPTGPTPAFPAAWVDGTAGTVTCRMRARVDAAGRPEAIEPVRCEEPFAHAATEALYGWTFPAPRCGGEPVASVQALDLTLLGRDPARTGAEGSAHLSALVRALDEPAADEACRVEVAFTTAGAVTAIRTADRSRCLAIPGKPVKASAGKVRAAGGEAACEVRFTRDDAGVGAIEVGACHDAARAAALKAVESWSWTRHGARATPYAVRFVASTE